MEKLKTPQGINTPSEGFVFDWNGVTYKLTGNFAPANQILGMERFQRFGPIEPASEQDPAAGGESKALRIAIFPGSFKPPHKGHVLAAQALAEEADIIYIFVSSPQLKGVRQMKAIKSISAEQAVQCWNALIDKTPLKNKARILIGPPGVASSMMTAINFIQHPADPNNLFAAPENATVILGVGAKGSDADRYGPRVMQKSQENRPDLTIKKMAVGPFEHSEEYLDILRENPDIAGILNKGKGRVSPDELSEEEVIEGKIADKQLYHASDMRDFIDLSAENPIGLKLLEDFVIEPADVLAVLGILGINPADSEEGDKEPEIPDLVDSESLKEYINQKFNILIGEGFTKQTPPTAKPDSGQFQKNMKRRLSQAHRAYLDSGRKDLVKFGTPFTSSRNRDSSNAFLAETEIEEMSLAGAVAGHVDQTRTNKGIKNKMISKQEKRLRMKIRKGLQEFFQNKAKEDEKIINSFLEEHELRLKLRDIILQESLTNLNEESEDPTTDIHDNTGINTLKDLFKNTNLLSTLRDVYKTLTTDEDQKNSFRAHIVQWTGDTLAPVRLNDTDSESGALSEQENVGIDILGVNDNRFIAADDGSEKDQPTESDEENKMKPIDGEDTTGRNKAERVYPIIEKSIIKYYAELDNSEDQEMFYDYLIANLKLYFDKWDNEMSKTVEEPTNDEYEQAAQNQAS